MSFQRSGEGPSDLFWIQPPPPYYIAYSTVTPLLHKIVRHILSLWIDAARYDVFAINLALAIVERKIICK